MERVAPRAERCLSIRRALARYPAWIARHRIGIVSVAGSLAIAGGLLSSTLPVRTEFSRLLPDREPSVAALHSLTARKPATAVVEIGIAAPDPDAARRFAAALAPALRRLPASLVREVDDDDLVLRSFVWRHRWLYAGEGEIRKGVEAVRALARQRNPFVVDLDADGDPREPLADLSRRLEELRARTIDRPAGYAGEGGRLRMIVVRAPFSDTEPRKGVELLSALQLTVAALRPAFPDVQVGYAGDPVTAALEHALVLRDVAISAVACLLLVLAALLAAFRSVRTVLALCANLLVACALTFGWTRLAIGQLNSATAFLGSVVAGNGINFGIILAARYREERSKKPHAGAMAEALARTAAPTLVAALAAAAAYLSLTVTEFRGFSEFGAIAGVGMAFSWATSYLVLPALLELLQPPPPADRRCAPLHRAPLPTRAVAAAAVLGALALTGAGIRLALRDPFDDDLGALRSRSLPASEPGRWSRRLDAAFGRTQSGGFVLGVDHPGDVATVLDALARAEEGVPLQARVLGKVDALPCVLPGEPEEQRRKTQLLSEARRLLGPAHPDLFPDEPLRVLEAADLPERLRQAFTEADGRIGLLLLVHPGPAFAGWSHRGIRRAVELLRGLRFDQPLHAPLQLSGPEVLFVDMMRAVERDAPRACLLSSALVVALLAAALGPGRDLAAATFALAAGVGGMLGAMALLGVRLNFLNAIAIPITIGIGIDYPFNVIARLRQEIARGGDVRAALRETGGAVVLCSLTTLIGYAVLLGSDTGAIRSFGLAAVLGEISCLLTALVTAPAALVLAGRLRR